MKLCASVIWGACLAVLICAAMACAVDSECVPVSVLAPAAAFCAFGGGTAGCVAMCAKGEGRADA